MGNVIESARQQAQAAAGDRLAGRPVNANEAAIAAVRGATATPTSGATAANALAGDAAPAQPEESGWVKQLAGVARMFIFYMVCSTAIKYLFGGNQQQQTSDGGVSVPQTDANGKAVQYTPMWTDHQPFTMLVYINDQPYLHHNQLTPSVLTADTLVWNSTHMTFDWAQPTLTANYTLNDQQFTLLKQNASLCAHTFFVQPHVSHYTTDSTYNAHKVVYSTHQLNQYRVAPKPKKLVNLLSKGDEQSETDGDADDSVQPAEVSKAVHTNLQSLADEDDTHADHSVATTTNKKQRPIINYWKPELTIRLVNDFNVFTPATLLPDIRSSVHIDYQTMQYWPVVYFDEFWLLTSKYIPINDTITEPSQLPLSLTYNTVSLLKWRTQVQLDTQWKNPQSQFLQSEEDTEQIKKMLVESNPYLLGITIIVSILHSVFDFLAFKNDVAFWRDEKKSHSGLSKNSILINTVCQFIVFFYLLDNETSYMILVSQGIGLAIECWKITKSFNITRVDKFPFVHFRQKNLGDETQEAENEEQQQLRLTAQYDSEAIQYLSYVLYPLVFGYSIYTLYYESHKSWYSWILSSLVGAVYAFGFILMCPQLYLNYKLKSVAHMPWRMMIYKFLGTIVDDLFAFVIAMPWLHRLSVFRDDVIFVLFLYQRYIYRIDYTRVNEFGVQLKPEEIQRLQREEDQKKLNGSVVSPTSAATTTTTNGKHTTNDIITSESTPLITQTTAEVTDDVAGTDNAQLRQRKTKAKVDA